MPRLRGAPAPIEGSAVRHEAIGQAEAEAEAAVAGQGKHEQRHEEQESGDQQGCEARVPQVRGARGCLGAQELWEEKRHEAQAKQPRPGEVVAHRPHRHRHQTPTRTPRGAHSPGSGRGSQSLAW